MSPVEDPTRGVRRAPASPNGELLPASFTWGWAIGGTEAEGGGLRNQWSEWSDRNADSLAAGAAAERAHPATTIGLPPPEAADPGNYRLGRACEMWTRYREDFTLARDFGFDAAHVSVEWSRIEPEPGVWDDDAVSHYRDMLSCLRELGQEPFVALWHFGNPLWFEARGAWRWRGAPEAFARYASRVVKALGDLVTFYVTVVEPKVYTGRAHLLGRWPPQERSLRAFFESLDRLVHAHRRAYAAVKEVRPDALVGASVNDMLSRPAAGPSYPLDWLVARGGEEANDWLFRTRIASCSDWLGLNYYTSRKVRRARYVEVGPEFSDVGWTLDPGGIVWPLLRMRRFAKPVYVTEFGVADRADVMRLRYIDETLAAIRLARSKGVDVRGAFYWSLLDNFEWEKGYWPKFGLVDVDRDTLERRARPSAALLSGLIARHRQA